MAHVACRNVAIVMCTARILRAVRRRPARVPGSRNHFMLDAATFAAWGVDYIKLDWCGQALRTDETDNKKNAAGARDTWRSRGVRAAGGRASIGLIRNL